MILGYVMKIWVCRLTNPDNGLQNLIGGCSQFINAYTEGFQKPRGIGN